MAALVGLPFKIAVLLPTGCVYIYLPSAACLTISSVILPLLADRLTALWFLSCPLKLHFKREFATGDFNMSLKK